MAELNRYKKLQSIWTKLKSCTRCDSTPQQGGDATVMFTKKLQTDRCLIVIQLSTSENTIKLYLSKKERIATGNPQCD